MAADPTHFHIPRASSVLAAVAACCLLVTALPARANTPQNITAGEVSRLPSYCAHSQSFEMRGTPDAPTDAQRQLLAVMGRTLWAIHHYCWALVNMHRADAVLGNPAQRRYLLEWAIKDCQYVVGYAPPDFVLLPEIHTRIGDLLVLLKRDGEAIPHFERSKSLKADYWPPYLRLSDIQLRIGRRQAAIDVLNEGLGHVPGEPRLLAALERLKAPAAATTAAPPPKPASRP